MPAAFSGGIVPKEHAFFYEEIRDLETDKEIKAEVHPLLKVDWGGQALKVESLRPIRLVMSYMAKVRGTPKESPFNSYLHGLALLAKSDLHLQFETNAFEQFFNVFKAALFTSGDWDGEEDLKAAADRGMGDEIENMDRCLQIGAKIENTKAYIPEITLEDVVWMKRFCDLYFLILAMRQHGLKIGSEADSEEL